MAIDNCLQCKIHFGNINKLKAAYKAVVHRMGSVTKIRTDIVNNEFKIIVNIGVKCQNTEWLHPESKEMKNVAQHIPMIG